MKKEIKDELYGHTDQIRILVDLMKYAFDASINGEIEKGRYTRDNVLKYYYDHARCIPRHLSMIRKYANDADKLEKDLAKTKKALRRAERATRKDAVLRDLLDDVRSGGCHYRGTRVQGYRLDQRDS